MSNPWEQNEGQSLRPWAVGIVCVSLAIIGMEIFCGGEEKVPAAVGSEQAAPTETFIGAPAESLVSVKGDGAEAFVERNWSDLPERREAPKGNEFRTLREELRERRIAATLSDLKGLFVAEAAPDANQDLEEAEKSLEAEKKIGAGKGAEKESQSGDSGDNQ